MGTRGAYGFRKNGVDKLSYNHFDSYPDYLGRNVVEFCKKHTIEELNELYDKIIMVKENGTPSEDQIKYCIENGWADFNVSSQSIDDWYCLLRNLQGDLEKLSKAKSQAYMTNGNNFIKDSLFCEYAYIINLDENIIEFYEGFQKKPQNFNRYGTTPDECGYYPCKLSLKFSLDDIYNADVDEVVKMMNLEEN